MKIKILGTRGEIKPSVPYHSKHSGILIDKKILFDLGEKIFLKEKPKHIFITHLHPDHAFFERKDQKFEKKIPIYAPKQSKKAKITTLSKQKIINSYKIMPIPTIHSLKVKSQAYLIEKGGKKILYTGDMIWIEKKYQTFLKHIDLVITEASFFKKGGMIRRDSKTGKIYGHNGVPNLINFFKSYTNNIILIHFGSWFYKNIKKARKNIKKLAKAQNIKITVGYDGLEITI
jgi:ribonuclease BN (tRNA processing enzyme)